MKFVALVLVAGGVGVALGTGLSNLSSADGPAPLEEAARTATAGARAAPTATAAPATTAASSSAAPRVPAPTATSSAAPADPLAEVRVSVVDARLFTDDTPSGREEQRARLMVRVRAENAGSSRLTLAPPVLRVGSVRLPAASGARFDPLAAGASQTVTLRFALGGEATPKLVRDRRARILIAGQSLPMRVKVRAPAR